MSDNSNITLSEDQEKALEKMLAWYNSHKNKDPKAKQVFYLAGWAGTGKTTIAKEFEKLLGNIKKVYGAFTGKAALRMRQTGMHGANTLHSIIYTVDVNKEGKPIFTIDRKSRLSNADILILDECSMVDELLGKDVTSFNVPILVLGDPGQLPPIKGQGYFTNRRPDVTLTQVHRQALENPIIQLATDIRNGSAIKKYNEPELLTYAKPDILKQAIIRADQVITGKNATRKAINDMFRSDYNSAVPEKGEKIICLRNDNKEGVFNGMMGIMQSKADASNGTYYLEFIDDEDTVHKVFAHPEGFENDDLFKDMDYSFRRSLCEFTFGYAITVHKSQGSQWDNVCIADDNMLVWDRPNRRRWLYTGVTRAAEKLILGSWPKGGFR